MRHADRGTTLARWFDEATRRTTTGLAARTSRRGFVGRVGALLAGSGALPLLPVARAFGAEETDATEADEVGGDPVEHLSELPDVPSLRGAVGSLVATPEGRAYIARVPEVAQSPLEDDDLARLLNWVLREFNAATLPERFRPLDGDEVGAARARILTDPIRDRAAIVGAYADSPPGNPEGAEPSDRNRD